MDAARHRNQDGGQISWRNESLRRHGALDRPEKPNLMGTLFSTRAEKGGKIGDTKHRNSAEDEELQALKKRARKSEK